MPLNTVLDNGTGPVWPPMRRATLLVTAASSRAVAVGGSTMPRRTSRGRLLSVIALMTRCQPDLAECTGCRQPQPRVGWEEVHTANLGAGALY